jgi:hypothetical protein
VTLLAGEDARQHIVDRLVAPDRLHDLDRHRDDRATIAPGASRPNPRKLSCEQQDRIGDRERGLDDVLSASPFE